MSAKLTKARETARDLYQQAIDALGDPTFWREWRREKDREDMLRSLMSNRVGRAAGHAALEGKTDG